MSYLDPTPFLAVSTQFSDEWAERSAHWMTETDRSAKPRKRRDRNTSPLILCGHGVSLRIQNGSLVIRDGFTHYPQEQASHRFFCGDLSLPPRIILIDGSGTLSFDVLTWLSEQGVSLVRIDWSGGAASVLAGPGYAADRDKVRWQETTRDDPARQVAFSVGLIQRKLECSLVAIAETAPHSNAQQVALDRTRQNLDRLQSSPPQTLKALLGLEADTAARYFAAWHGAPLQWRGSSRHPIPDAWRTIGSRSSGRKGTQATNRRATHPVNAMLNYAYAVLQARVQNQVVADGYDPTIGIMHGAYRGKPGFVLDMMEPDRPKIDAAVLSFAQSETFTGSDFTIRSDGVCRLSPQLARRVCGLAESHLTVPA